MKPELSEVIKIVNDVRTKALGMDALANLPQGKPMKSYSCPLAKAFGRCYVDQDIIVVTDEEIAIAMSRALSAKLDVNEGVNDEYLIEYFPKILSNFVVSFDNNEYPELIEQEEK